MLIRFYNNIILINQNSEYLHKIDVKRKIMLPLSDEELETILGKNGNGINVVSDVWNLKKQKTRNLIC
jgi:hypothetical protein